MADHQQIYHQGADHYQRLIAREDYQGNLLPAIRLIKSPDGLDIIDLGAGTGRLACLLGPFARSVYAFDSSPHMLEVGVQQIRALGLTRWLAAAADHRRVPLPSGFADLVVSGWSICYLVVWEGQGWQASLQQGLQEMRRLLRKGGSLVIIETLGTGEVQPQIPDKLAGYFRYLEDAGFNQTWIRTDYRFRSRSEASELVEFFFGAEMLAKIGPGEYPVLPECTGIWWINAS
jgi:SAM-dependent methyltransferase